VKFLTLIAPQAFENRAHNPILRGKNMTRARM
jgi:hypothetical protein